MRQTGRPGDVWWSDCWDRAKSAPKDKYLLCESGVWGNLLFRGLGSSTGRERDRRLPRSGDGSIVLLLLRIGSWPVGQYFRAKLERLLNLIPSELRLPRDWDLLFLGG